MNRPSVTLPMPNQASNTSYNNANQMLSFNDKNITYDNNGNMTSVTNSCGTTNYTWDVRNRLTGIGGFNVDCSSLTASFKYDALNRRIEKTINGVMTKYLYDGADIIQELNQDGSVKANYIRGLNIDEPLARLTPNASRYYQTDALGSVIALTDDTGAVKTTYTYDAFGNTTISGESSDNPFQYTGRENDGTGLYYYRARYYSPELQRFISEDPIGLVGGINKFVYTENNPIRYKDPQGLTVGAAIGAAFGVGVGCIIGHCTYKCNKRCKELYPQNISDELGGYDLNYNQRMRCFFNCELYCASFGLFGSDPLTGPIAGGVHAGSH